MELDCLKIKIYRGACGLSGRVLDWDRGVAGSSLTFHGTGLLENHNIWRSAVAQW